MLAVLSSGKYMTNYAKNYASTIYQNLGTMLVVSQGLRVQLLNWPIPHSRNYQGNGMHGCTSF